MREWSIAVGSGIVSVPPGINFAAIKPSMCPVHFRCVPAMVTFFSARCARPWVTMKYAKNLCIITFTLSFRYVVGYLCCLRQCVVRLLLLGNVSVRWLVVRWLVRAAGELDFWCTIYGRPLSGWSHGMMLLRLAIFIITLPIALCRRKPFS